MGSHRLTVGAVKARKWRKTQPSQDAAAGLLGIGQQYLSKVERGERVPQKWDVIKAFRDVCGIGPEEWERLSREVAPPRAKGRSRTRAA